MEKNTIIDGRLVKAFCCYFTNIPKEMVEIQKKVFDKFGMHLNQELSRVPHGIYMDNIMKNIDSDIYIFFDIDAIPLKPGLYEYMVEQIKDDNSLIGIEEAPNHVDYRNVYAGPACFGITRVVYDKIGKPTFMGKAGRCDTAGELTFAAQKHNVDVKLILIEKSMDRIWRCGENKWFGHGTFYDGWVYHEFETPTLIYQMQFISRCKHVLSKV